MMDDLFIEFPHKNNTFFLKYKSNTFSEKKNAQTNVFSYDFKFFLVKIIIIDYIYDFKH